MSAIDPHKAELHASGFRAILEVATDVLGSEAIATIVESRGVTLAELSDPNGWFSLEFAESLILEIHLRAGDSAWLDRAMRLGVTPKYLGILYPLFRSFGTPAFTYKQTVSIVQRLNKTMSWRLEELGAQFARFRAWPAQGASIEKSVVMCRVRFVQLEALATMFDLPPATVVHDVCLHRGGEACIYEVRWKEHRRPLWSLGGLTAGALAGVGSQMFLGVAPLPALGLASALGIGGWALGRTRELRRDLKSRIDEINESHDALLRSTRANEERFAELVEAKSEVEAKVEQRTRELRQATTRLSETLDEIQQLDRAKTDFFNNVSHELRSPLTLILAPLGDLVAGRTPAGGNAAAFEAMQSSSKRLLRLINQLLDLAKIDAGEMKLSLASVDLMGLLRSSLVGFEAAAEKKGVRIDLKGPANMPNIALDPAWIESAITNLVANALRLTAHGAVQIAVVDHGAEVSISVADDGPGIAPEDQKKIFARFAQGDSTKRVIGGTGIGLALVREAARLHGGDVKLSSELGKGATFTLTIPRQLEVKLNSDGVGTGLVPAKTTFVEEFADDTGTLERTGPTPNASLALVVEDNPELRVFISDVLATKYHVRAVSDGAKALAAVSNLRPDVIVSDVAMPLMDGYALCRQLRADPETNAIPIVLVTARTEVSSVLEGFEAGANDYLLKPFHGRELLARVDVHVRLRRLAQELALRERHAMLGVLAASVAHQVRNPLTTLVSGLPAMRAKLDGHVSQSTFELIDLMVDCAGRIERLTGDLMDLSRVDREAGGDFRPSDGLRSAIRIVGARVPDSVVIEERIEDSPIISGRPGDMNHVFMNLLDNAARAVGQHGRIRIVAELEPGSYAVRVADSGPGVDAEIAQRIFEPFFTTRPAGEGTGLGLAIAAQVVQQCGGTIRVERSDLGGAVFTVKIPTDADRSHVSATGPLGTMSVN
jgi:signal transduction histidine kinase